MSRIRPEKSVLWLEATSAHTTAKFVSSVIVSNQLILYILDSPNSLSPNI